MRRLSFRNRAPMTDPIQKTLSLFDGAVVLEGAGVRVPNPAVLRTSKMDQLVRQAVLGSPAEQEGARWVLWELGQATGVRPASIHDLYVARGTGKCRGGFTVPAMISA